MAAAAAVPPRVRRKTRSARRLRRQRRKPASCPRPRSRSRRTFRSQCSSATAWAPSARNCMRARCRHHANAAPPRYVSPVATAAELTWSASRASDQHAHARRSRRRHTMRAAAAVEQSSHSRRCTRQLITVCQRRRPRMECTRSQWARAAAKTIRRPCSRRTAAAQAARARLRSARSPSWARAHRCTEVARASLHARQRQSGGQSSRRRT